MKRIIALLAACFLMMTGTALAQIEWPEPLTGGPSALKNYVDTVNAALAAQNAGQIDMAYELYDTFASLGMDGVALPDDFSLSFTMPVEMFFEMSGGSLYTLTLRVSDVNRFSPIAAACLYAACPDVITLSDAKAVTDSYAAPAIADAQALRYDEDAPTHSYEEEINTLQSAQPRAYFAYYPDQYGDDVTWLQMTLIFPRPGSAQAAFVLGATPAPPAAEEEYEGYYAEDNYSHLELFASPTPEPDSAAME